ncbi:hypothetical protein [Alicyclobacillus sp. SO9]|uniref:alpha/beta family hydrolase n=1 Tax=Alicyclobacillus sp. SO9 TaxID=2665646 RepID=UPI0018E8754D|nr:hypothetical protein [Alicyclobacillus sp. SO9]QQE77253.1 hypothetical protein GI364_14935 [Alicyclobacillus sp. SO9]
MSTIHVPTRWGAIPASYSFVQQTPSSSKLAVLFPGFAYPLDAPLMRYAASAAYDSGCDVLGVEYGYQANRADLQEEDQSYLVDEIVVALKNNIGQQYSNVVFIGKSLGTIIQTEVARNIGFSVENHVFLTPLRKVIPSIRDAENALVVVGDNDSLFNSSDISEVANLPNVQLHVLSGANHQLETDNYRESIDLLKTTAMLCGGFCKHL